MSAWNAEPTDFGSGINSEGQVIDGAADADSETPTMIGPLLIVAAIVAVVWWQS